MPLMTAILITIFGLVWLDELLVFMGVTDTLLPYARVYTRIILLGAVTSTGFSNLIRAEGSSRYAMYIWVIPMGANILIDCTLIFILRMGVIGAAIGTVAGQGISMAMSIYFFYISGKSVRQFRLQHFCPDIRLIGEIIGIGGPAFLQLCGQSLSLIVANQFLRQYGGDLAISSYGIAYKIVVFFLFPVQGLSQGLQPIIGYNKGSGHQKRTDQALRLASATACVYGICVYLVTLAFADIFMKVFTSDSTVIEMGIHILGIVNAAVLFSGIQNIQTTYFQALGKKVISLIMALCGQLLCFVPAVSTLSRFLGLDGVWWAFPASAMLSLAISSMLTMIQLKKTEFKSSDTRKQ